MSAPNATRRRLVAIALATERANLERLLAAIARAAIVAYGGEPIAEAYPHVEVLLERLILSAADLGAFLYFGVRDSGDLLGLPAMLYPGGVVGSIGAEVGGAARLIIAGGSRARGARPRDLVLSGADR